MVYMLSLHVQCHAIMATAEQVREFSCIGLVYSFLGTRDEKHSNGVAKYINKFD